MHEYSIALLLEVIQCLQENYYREVRFLDTIRYAEFFNVFMINGKRIPRTIISSTIPLADIS